MKLAIEIYAPPKQAKKMSVAATNVIIGPLKLSAKKLMDTLDLKVNKDNSVATLTVTCYPDQTIKIIKGVAKYNYLLQRLYKSRLMKNTLKKMTPLEQEQIAKMLEEPAKLIVLEEAKPEELTYMKKSLKQRVKDLWQKKAQ